MYRKVPLAACLSATGRKPIGVRWIDINKGDAASPRYRSRLVVKEYNNSKQPELFAAKPPAEGQKVMLSKLAQGQGKTRLLYADVSRAYFYAPAVRPVYVALPVEDQDPSDPIDTCGELAFSMYGTRDAALNWAEEYSSKLLSAGFIRGVANPCLFKHRVKDVSLTAYAGKTIRVAFLHSSSSFNVSNGWYVDDVSVSVF